jgi:signal transduction histidine kinase
LRTPIHAINSTIEHLLSSELSNRKLGETQTRTELGQALHGCKRMAGLVEDLVLVSTLYNTDGQDLIMRPEAVNTKAFMEAQIAQVRSIVPGLVYLSLDVDSMVPDTIVIDHARLSQITTNLLTNAAKFTQRGCIRLTCTAVASKAKEPMTLKIAVQDTGPKSHPPPPI